MTMIPDSTALIKMLAGYFAVFAVIFIFLIVLMIASTWRIFKKAGTGGWKALIPVYCDYTLYKIAWKKKYFFLTLIFGCLSGGISSLIPHFPEYQMIFSIVSTVLMIIAVIIDILSYVKLAKAFRKGVGFAIGLMLLPIIFFPILAFGKARYRRRKRRRKKVAPTVENA